MIEFCKKIGEVPEPVKRYTMNSYLEQSNKLQWINFYKTRLKERKDVCDEAEIELQIFKIFDMLKGDFNRLIKKRYLHTPLTLVESIVSL